MGVITVITVITVMSVMVCTYTLHDKQKNRQPEGQRSKVKYKIVFDLLFALHILVDSLCRLATRAHGENYGSRTCHGITARKDSLA